MMPTRSRTGMRAPGWAFPSMRPSGSPQGPRLDALKAWSRHFSPVSATTLALAGALSIVTGVSFALVARAVSRRLATEDRRLARRAHATWWLCLGGYLVL